MKITANISNDSINLNGNVRIGDFDPSSLRVRVTNLENNAVGTIDLSYDNQTSILTLTTKNIKNESIGIPQTVVISGGISDINYNNTTKSLIITLSNGEELTVSLKESFDELAEQIPTKLSELTNDTGFITSLVDNLTNYYLKSDTYTKTEVNNIIAAIPKVKLEIVQNFPEAGPTYWFDNSHTIYLSPKSTSQTQNIYDEYLCTRSGIEGNYTYSWEKIGDTEIDLSNYVQKTLTIAGIDLQDNITKSELQNALTDSTHNFVTDSEKSTWNAKQNALSQSQLDAVDSGITSTLVGQITTNQNNITTINDKIPNQASSSNQLADKDFVNSSINALAAFFITRTALGDNFNTYAQLSSATTFYSGGESRIPTQNDYTYVRFDETKGETVTGYSSFTTTDDYIGHLVIYNNEGIEVTSSNKDNLGITPGTTIAYDNLPTTRYSYQGGTYPNGQWNFQLIVNNSALTSAQMAALNSGITSSLVTQIETNTTDIANKMDKANPTGTGSLSLNRASNTTIGANSVALGNNTTASGINSTALGAGTTASGFASHAEGNNNYATGDNSHAENASNTASGDYSHVQGHFNNSYRRSQHVFGEYNVADQPSGTTSTDRGTYVEIVGNGTSTFRSNARTLDWDGNEILAGTLQTTGLKDGNNANYKLNLPNTTNWTTDKTIATTDEIPTQTSQLTNNSGFITNTVSNLANYYLKSETYTKTEVNNLIGSITTISLQIVSTLPEPGPTYYFNTSKTIYLAPKSTAQTQNIYDEYICTRAGIEGSYTYSWEKIGDTQIDLSGYVPTSRTINGKALTSNITLTANDVGALASNTPYVSSVNGSSGAITGLQTTSNLVTSFSSVTSNSKYPSERLVKNSLNAKQDSLISGTNIKTINNQSLLGSGNITISGGSSSGVYKGTFDNWTAVPSSGSSYEGGTAPVNNDYIMVMDCTDKYSYAELSFDKTTQNVTYTNQTTGYTETIALQDIDDFSKRRLIDNAFYIYYFSIANTIVCEARTSLIYFEPPSTTRYLEQSEQFTFSSRVSKTCSITYYGTGSGEMFLYDGDWSIDGKNGWKEIMPITTTLYRHQIVLGAEASPEDNNSETYSFDVSFEIITTKKEPFTTLLEISSYIINNFEMPCCGSLYIYGEGPEDTKEVIINKLLLYKYGDSNQSVDGTIWYYTVEDNYVVSNRANITNTSEAYINDRVKPL